MELPSFIVPFLSIVLALALAVFAVTVWFVPSFVGFLPWAGVLAGLLAVLQSLNLHNAARAARLTLALAGIAAMVFMFAVLGLRA